MKRRRPTASRRAEQRVRKKIVNEGFSPVNINPNGGKGSISFYSMTLMKVRENSRSTTFIVRTKKPLRWGDFIEKVTDALSEVI